MNSLMIKKIQSLFVEDKDKGVYKSHRSMFTDPEIFDLEIKHIFEGNWIFLGHQSQVQNKNDFFTYTMGRQPVFITRNKDNELKCFLNACTHRGALLCRTKKGNRAAHTCPFHGWVFNNNGKLVKVKDPDDAGYPDSFNCKGSLDLTEIARFENYRGFLFGSLNDDVLPLKEYLGDTTKMIDMLVDQSPDGADGWEVLRGTSTYTYDANWKVQAENGADGYHLTAVHWNYVATTTRRDKMKDKTKAMDASKWGDQKGGFYAFKNGHISVWSKWADPTTRPIFSRKQELVEQFGETKADWMTGYLRNLCLYPNVFLMDQFGTQIRHFRPISVDKTEVTIYCLAPKGESDELRYQRIRQYEDFFNATGMATPDDLEEFRSCQEGFEAAGVPWNDLCRGATHWIEGPDQSAKELGIDPIMSGIKSEDEGLFAMQHKCWVETLTNSLRKEGETAIDASAE